MFESVQNGSIKYFKSDLFDGEDVVHAFSTRIGGETPSPLDSFSMSTAGFEGFDKYVENNRERICDALGVDYKKLIIPEQKHTDNIKIVRSVSDDVSDTDGLITDIKGLVLMLMFADCVPVILYEPKKHILSVIHAGWRGSAKGIAAKAVKIFVDEFGVEAESVKALIGPAIGKCCYPVSKEVALELKRSVNNKYEDVFQEDLLSDNIEVDLKLLNYYQLKEAGVNKIDNIGYCTFCNNSLFYSYRAEQGKTGRHCAVASLK